MIYTREIELFERNGKPLYKESEHNPSQSVFDFAKWISQFESDRYLLASCSWQDLDFYKFLLNTDKRVLVFNCYDPLFNGSNNTVLLHYIKSINQRSNITVVGNNVDNYLNYWCLPFAPEGNFKNYLQDEFLNFNFSKVFLCYQRSNTGNRKQLYDALSTLSDYGTATYAQWDNGSCAVSNDIYTLGEMSIWNSHFLNIVSETQYEWFDPYQIFLSEKTWKPIYGMRPFLHFTNIYANDFLKEQGFELFWEDFGCTFSNDMNVNNQINQIVNAIEFLKNENLNKLYNKLLPKIKHNRYNLNRFIQRQKDKINFLKTGCFNG